MLPIAKPLKGNKIKILEFEKVKVEKLIQHITDE